MKREGITVNVGDWVHSDSPGIWRVYRVIENVQRMRFDLQDRKRVDRNRYVFSKRFLDVSWKPAFAAEVANGEIVQPLSAEQKRRLVRFIEENPRAFAEFEAFDPRDINTVMNLRLDIPLSVGKQRLQELVADVFFGIERKGLTNAEVLERIANSELAGYRTRTVSNAMLQFVSIGHEIRGGEFVFHRAQVTTNDSGGTIPNA